MLEDFIAGCNYLKMHKDCNGKIVVVRFCFGEWISNRMTVKTSKLDADITCYGRQPSNEDAIKIKALLFYYTTV